MPDTSPVRSAQITPRPTAQVVRYGNYAERRECLPAGGSRSSDAGRLREADLNNLSVYGMVANERDGNLCGRARHETLAARITRAGRYLCRDRTGGATGQRWARCYAECPGLTATREQWVRDPTSAQTGCLPGNARNRCSGTGRSLRLTGRLQLSFAGDAAPTSRGATVATQAPQAPASDVACAPASNDGLRRRGGLVT